MAFNLGDIIVTIKANTADLQRGLGQVEAMANKTKGFADGMGAAFAKSTAASKQFAIGVAAAGTAAIAFGVTSVKAFEDSENRIAQTNAVLKSTGDIAGVTADSVTKLASSLERQTKFSDESVRSVENLLLTFTAIGKDIFPQATKTVLDMATALGEDTSSASIQLGKALQDPILGVTALRRVGVNFNKAQQEVIKNLVDTGQSAKAQQLILAELNREFGGSAAAAGDTYSGKLAKLKNQFNNVQEAIGGTIIQGLQPLVNWLSKATDKINEQGGLLKILQDFWKRNKDNLIVVAGAITGAIVPALVAMAGSLLLNMIYLSPFIAAGAALAYAWNKNKTLFYGLVTVITALAGAIGIYLLPNIIKATKAFAGPTIQFAKWAAQAVISAATWTAQMAIMVAKAIATGIVNAAQAVVSGAAWAAQAVVASAAWTAQFIIMVAKATPAAALMALKAADVGTAWVINAARASFVWVTTELPKIVAGFVVTSASATVQAAVASASWVKNAVVSSAAWVINELPKIVFGFITTSAAATVQAGISSASWIRSAAASSAAWVVTELPKIIAGFVLVAGAAVVNAAISSAAWITAAVRSSAAWLTSIATTSATFGALSALIATPLVMPAIAVAAALASVVLVYNKIQETQNLLDKLNSQTISENNSTEQAEKNVIAAYKAGKISKAAYQKFFQSISQNASGTNFWKGGLTWVGEKGAELVNLPMGSQIFPNSLSQKMAGLSGPGSTTNNKSAETNIYGDINIASQADADYFLQRLDRDHQLENMGLSPA